MKNITLLLKDFIYIINMLSYISNNFRCLIILLLWINREVFGCPVALNL